MKIRRRYLFSMGILGGVWLLSLFFVYYVVLVPQQISLLKNKSRLLVYTVQEAAPTMNISERQSFVEKMKRLNPELSYVLFLDQSGKAVAHSDPTRVGKFFNDPGSLAAAQDGRTVEQLYVRDPQDPSSPFHNERVVDILAPFQDKAGKHIGAVNVGLSLRAVERLKRSFYGLFLFSCTLFLLFLVFVARSFLSRVITPLGQLAQATKKIQEGDFHLTLPEGGDDEIALLMQEFQRMSQRLLELTEDLKERERELQDYIDHLVSSTAKLSPEGIILRGNQTLSELTGLGSDGLKRLKFWELPLWAGSQEARERVRSALQKSSLGYTVQLEEKIQTGSERINTMELVFRPVSAADGSIDYILAEGIDISERKRMEEELRVSEERYRLLFDNGNDSIFILQDGYIRFCNPATYRMTGSTERELTSRPFTEFIHSEDREIVARFSKTGKGVGEELPLVRFVERTGATLWLEINAVPFPWQGQKALLCMARNITSQVLMKAQLEEAQKLEAVGILSGGLAHDFNNLLQGISGYTGLLALRPNLSENDKEKLNAINKLVGRATHLIKQLLLFSRKVESQLRPVEVNKAVQSVVEMLRTVLPKMVEIRLDLLNAPLTIQADPVQFEQILMNLSLNAKDAMNEEGVLTVSTDIAVVDEETLPLHGGLTPGKYACLRVEDTGKGMTRETLAHLFEPFFTTKSVGKGTGLGLSIVYGLVKNHKGAVTCESTPGVGTRFSLYFPLDTSSPSPLHEEPPLTNDAPRGRGETILLVDDEEDILSTTEDILTQYGYSILKAGSGEEAIKLYRFSGDKIGLIILDLNMPGMGGLKTIEELRGLNKHVKIIVSSGFLMKENREQLERKTPAATLSKPYHLRDLLRTVRETLDSPGKGYSMYPN